MREVVSAALLEDSPERLVDLGARTSASSPPSERLEDEREEVDARDGADARDLASSWRTRGDTKLELFGPRDSLAISDFCWFEPAPRFAELDFFASSIARGSCFAMLFGAPLFGTPACSSVGEAG